MRGKSKRNIHLQALPRPRLTTPRRTHHQRSDTPTILPTRSKDMGDTTTTPLHRPSTMYSLHQLLIQLRIRITLVMDPLQRHRLPPRTKPLRLCPITTLAGPTPAQLRMCPLPARQAADMLKLHTHLHLRRTLSPRPCTHNTATPRVRVMRHSKRPHLRIQATARAPRARAVAATTN